MFKHRDHTHGKVSEARACEAVGTTPSPGVGADLVGLTGECRGGVCRSIDELCSRHSQQYQRRYGRASNE